MRLRRIAVGFLETAQLLGLAVAVLILGNDSLSLHTPMRLRYELELKKLATTVERFRAECGVLPARLDELAVAAGRACRPQAVEPARLHDAWSRPYRYQVQGSGFELRSAGADGVVFSADDIVSGDTAAPWRDHYRPPTDWPRLLAALATVLMAGLLIAKLSSLLWRAGRLLVTLIWRLRSPLAGLKAQRPAA